MAAFLLLTTPIWTSRTVLGLVAGADGWPATHPAGGTGTLPGVLAATAVPATTALGPAYDHLFGTALGASLMARVYLRSVESVERRPDPPAVA